MDRLRSEARTELIEEDKKTESLWPELDSYARILIDRLRAKGRESSKSRLERAMARRLS